jgi:hypothetical protein
MHPDVAGEGDLASASIRHTSISDRVVMILLVLLLASQVLRRDEPMNGCTPDGVPGAQGVAVLASQLSAGFRDRRSRSKREQRPCLLNRGLSHGLHLIYLPVIVGCG